MRASNMTWFAVRTFFRTRIVGRARKIDSQFVRGIAGIEDRIVVLRARNRKSALEKATASARKYARDNRWKNCYHQDIITEMLPVSYSYELDDNIEDGSEVYSNTEIVRAGESNKSIIGRKLGLSSRPVANMFIASSVAEVLDTKVPGWKK